MFNWNAKEEFLNKVYRRSHSEHSRRFYGNGIENFHAFCNAKKVVTVIPKNVYKVLDSYAEWLDAKHTKPKTIADYMSAVRKFLGYLDMVIDPTTFKSKVTMPRVSKIADEPLKLEDVRTILSKGRPNKKTRALILVLLSSGMRIGEALSVRVGDLDTSSEPPTILIKAEYAKTRTARVAYMSDEARDALKEVIVDAPKERLAFDYSGDLWQREKVTVRTFREVVERAGLGQKIENHRIHKIHFHNFRKFFLTKGTDKIGEHAAHALCGHGFYMDTYYRKSEEERKQDYLALMPSLTAFGSIEMEAEHAKLMREIRVNLSMLIEDESQREQMMKEIEKFGPKMTQDEILQSVRKMLRNSSNDPLLKWAKEPKATGHSSNNGLLQVDPQKKRISCSEEEVQKYLDMGYVPRFEMRNGSVVMEYEA